MDSIQFSATESQYVFLTSGGYGPDIPQQQEETKRRKKKKEQDVRKKIFRLFFAIIIIIGDNYCYFQPRADNMTSHNDIYTAVYLHCMMCQAVLDAFAKTRKATISFVMHVRLSVCPHGSTRIPLDRFSLKLIFQCFFFENM
jgi:hypothetical protein